MADAPVALDGLQPLQVHAQLAAQIAFDHVLPFLDRVHNFRELPLVQILGANARVNARRGQDVHGVLRADAIDVAQRDVDALVRRNFHSNDAGHKQSLVSSTQLSRSKSKIPNPKSEVRNPTRCRSFHSQIAFGFRISAFGLLLIPAAACDGGWCKSRG